MAFFNLTMTKNDSSARLQQKSSKKNYFLTKKKSTNIFFTKISIFRKILTSISRTYLWHKKRKSKQKLDLQICSVDKKNLRHRKSLFRQEFNSQAK